MLAVVSDILNKLLYSNDKASPTSAMIERLARINCGEGEDVSSTYGNDYLRVEINKSMTSALWLTAEL